MESNYEILDKIPMVNKSSYNPEGQPEERFKGQKRWHATVVQITLEELNSLREGKVLVCDSYNEYVVYVKLKD